MDEQEHIIDPHQALLMLEVRLDASRDTRPHFADGTWEAWREIIAKVRELRATLNTTNDVPTQREKALDVAAECLRFAMGEHLADKVRR